MAAIRGTASTIFARTIFHPTPRSQICFRVFAATFPITVFGSAHCRMYGGCSVRCAATKTGGDDKKSPARLAEVQRLLYQAEERYKAAGGGVEPIPKINLGWLSEREIIDAASYVPPPPTEETVKKIAKLSAIAEHKRLDNKKAQSQEKAIRRSRDIWD